MPYINIYVPDGRFCDGCDYISKSESLSLGTITECQIFKSKLTSNVAGTQKCIGCKLLSNSYSCKPEIPSPETSPYD